MALEGGEGSVSCPGRSLRPVPIVQEAGWAPGPVWTGAENLAPTGIRSPDRPARSQSLYRQCYLAHYMIHNVWYLQCRLSNDNGEFHCKFYLPTLHVVDEGIVIIFLSNSISFLQNQLILLIKIVTNNNYLIILYEVIC